MNPVEIERCLVQYGGFHDAVVERIEIDISKGLLILDIDDLLANFRGLDGADPDGSEPGTLKVEFSEIVAAVDSYDPHLRIYDVEIVAEEGIHTVTIKFSPSGRFTMKASNLKIETR